MTASSRNGGATDGRRPPETLQMCAVVRVARPASMALVSLESWPMTTKILNGSYGAVYKLTSPVTVLSITTRGYLYSGLLAAGPGSYSISNQGAVVGNDFGISLAGRSSITN